MALNDRRPPPNLGWRISALRRPVGNLHRAISFYTDGLGFEVETRVSADRAVLRLGNERIELVERSATCSPAPPPVPSPDVRFQHAAIVVTDMAAAFDRLASVAPRAITRGGPQRLPVAAGGVEAFKFVDPDGHPLELIWFPPGTGDVRWRQGNCPGPTVGIDHFALSVSDLRRSLAFYESMLGFTVVARQTNQGTQQGRLDGLDSEVVVEVVALASGVPGTPHIELLHYRHPSPRTHEHAEVFGAIDCLLLERLANRSGRGQEPQPLPARDPDGHALECTLTLPS